MTIIWSAKIPWKPPSSNHSYLRAANRRMYMDKETKEYKDDVARFALLTYSGQIIEDDVYVEITHYFKDKRRRDATNYHKALLDCLQGIIYKDDSQCRPVLLDRKVSEDGTDYSIIKIYAQDI